MKQGSARIGFVMLLAAGAVACADGRAEEPLDRAAVHQLPAPVLSAASDTVPLYDNLGDHHREIRTADVQAQAYFDQGLRLQYAFNHAEAIRSYERAIQLDPQCAMCWWGIALAHGPNINAPMDSAAGVAARQAIDAALDLTRHGPAAEQALIQALDQRYAADPTAARAPLDSAYARAMEVVATSFPNDADALTLYAASLMNLSPWFYWTGDYANRQPRPDTPSILEALERALELDVNHPGACHYYIHSVEAAYPGKAVPCAERLAGLMPGAGHIVHMPGHIYIRVGRYADAVEQNEHAVHADETYIRDQNPRGLYPSGYYPHNYHFMWFAATMAGMREKALYASRQVATKVPLEVALQIYWIQNVFVLPQLTLLTFGDWEGVLSEPMPPTELENASAMSHYARGIALAALGRKPDAEAELRAIEAIAARTGATDTSEGPELVVAIARHALAGEIAMRTGDPEIAVQRLRIASELEDGMVYEEPPVWYLPVRHSLGRALLEADLPSEAEKAYREDLERFPANGWSLIGLSLALEAQGRSAEAGAEREKFEVAWGQADTQLTGSRF
jgi:tetratricopeptide (TPR) repeat protein